VAFTHPIAAVALASPFYRRDVRPVVWLWAAFLTALPDIDFVGYQMGIPYPHPFGHRGFTHSLLFAALVAFGSAWYFRKEWKRSVGSLCLFLFLCAASHGLLDGMTDGGLGVAYFAPFDNTRYWMPWRPIPVAPLGPRLIFSAWGYEVVKAELIYLWVPSLLIAAAVLAARWPRLARDSDSAR
jgi:inner membrane protein